MPARWKRLSSQRIGGYRIFNLLQEQFESPRNGHALAAVILEAPDWVNVIAVAEAGDCVMIRQYRFGSDAVTLEIPGGMIDLGETPLLAAQRELHEETGYAAQCWTSLGSISPNPAFARNRLHMFLAEGCTRVGDQQQDASEDIEVVLIPQLQVDGLIAEGAIDHALVVVAFQKLALFRRGFLPA
jgi:8-oxo-dGTP pyrophosphatase MutT (NUDIX family)